MDSDPRTEILPGQRPPGHQPLDRDPPRQRPPWDSNPWTETLPDRDPPGQRPLSHVTCGVCWDRDPPVNRITVMSALKAYIAMNWPGSKTFSFLVFNDKYKTAQNLNACKCSTNFCDLVKKQECIPVGCILTTETPTGQIPPRQRSSPLDRDPTEIPPGQRLPWTETPLDRDPQNRDPTRQRPPKTENQLDRDPS